MISSKLFPSKEANTTKLPILVAPLPKGSTLSTKSIGGETNAESHEHPRNNSETSNINGQSKSPIPPRIVRSEMVGMLSGDEGQCKANPLSRKLFASHTQLSATSRRRPCHHALLQTWTEGDEPIYTYEIITRNGKSMIEAAFKARSWWGPCKTTWEEDDQCTLFFYPYNRTGDRAIIRARGKTDPSTLRLWNHVEWNKWLTSKKGLYFSLREYCDSQKVVNNTEACPILNIAKNTPNLTSSNYSLEQLAPATYYIQSGSNDDEEMRRFIEHTRRLATDDTIENKDDAEKETIQNENRKEQQSQCSTNSLSSASTRSNAERNYWIVKPAAGSNQGDGIRVLGGDDVVEQLQRIISSGGEDDVQGGRGGNRGWKQFGWIVQKYIERPLLVHGRKFDLRCYVLLVLENPGVPKAKGGSLLKRNQAQEKKQRMAHHSDRLTAFLYDEGYVRTSSCAYSLNKDGLSNIAAHLTNDAVQKQFDGGYGKHEAANKLDFKQFQSYLSLHHDAPSDYVQNTLLPTLREYVRVSVMAASQAAFKASQGGMEFSRLSSTGQLEYEADGRGRGGGGLVQVTRDMDPNADEPLPAHGYELMGYDFMIDEQFQVQLIEVNSNPCMDRPCRCLKDLLPRLNEDVFRTAIDPFFPVPKAFVGMFARAEREKSKNGFTKVFP